MPFDAALTGGRAALHEGGAPASRRRGAHRLAAKALLIGTSMLVYAAVPTAAAAQEECGATPPPPGGVLHCPTPLNPYPNGITYDPVPVDLTLVLDPGVVTQDGVRVNSNAQIGDLRVEGRDNTSVTGASRPGISVTTAHGDVYIGADEVATSGAGNHGIVGRTDGVGYYNGYYGPAPVYTQPSLQIY